MQLARAKKTLPHDAEFRFARFFAIAWRLVVAIALVSILSFNLLTSRGFVSYPDRDNILTFEITIYAMSLCVVVAILASVEHWRLASRTAVASRRYRVSVSLRAILMTLLMVMDGTTLEYLVHRAVAGIESAQSPRWRRPGVYVSLGDEGYRTLWLALLAVLCLVAAAVTVTRLRSSSGSRRGNWFRIGAVAAFLFFPVAFCYWYYVRGLERLSPDIASVP